MASVCRERAGERERERDGKKPSGQHCTLEMSRGQAMCCRYWRRLANIQNNVNTFLQGDVLVGKEASLSLVQRDSKYY